MMQHYSEDFQAVWNPAVGEIDLTARNASIIDLYNFISRLANRYAVHKSVRLDRKVKLPDLVCTS